MMCAEVRFGWGVALLRGEWPCPNGASSIRGDGQEMDDRGRGEGGQGERCAALVGDEPRAPQQCVAEFGGVDLGEGRPPDRGIGGHLPGSFQACHRRALQTARALFGVAPVQQEQGLMGGGGHLAWFLLLWRPIGREGVHEGLLQSEFGRPEKREGLHGHLGAGKPQPLT